MRHRILTVLAAVIMALVIAPAAQAGKLEHKANTLRSKVVKKFGPEAAGRDIIRQGVRTKHGTKPAPHALKVRYVRTLDRTLNPPPPPPVAAPVVSQSVPTNAPTTAPTSAGSGGAGGGLASIRACESGGNYSTNTGNGFSGAYQFDDSTWRAAGGSTAHAYQASPAEQDQVAAGWVSGHRSAWPHC